MLEERDQAAQLYELVFGCMKTGAVVSVSCAGLIQTSAGIAAACGEQWEKAEQHFETALRQAHEVPHRIEQPAVRRWQAWMLLSCDEPGDRERAREMLTEAIGMYREIGTPKHLDIAETMLAGAGD